jgi:hypothetical protein
MSGIFLSVWSNVPTEESVLKTTSGGYPHITLFYSGKGTVEPDELADFGCQVLKNGYARKMRIVGAYVNSFFHERKGKQRYDVLMKLDENTMEWIQATRVESRKRFGPVAEKFSMVSPHVTHAIFWSREDAEACLADLEKRLVDDFEVEFAGYSIN